MFFYTYILIVSGISIIISKSIFFERFRNFIEKKSPFFGEGINCPMCVGFWVGITISLIGISPTLLYIYPNIEINNHLLIYYYKYIIIFLDGPISSMISWIFYTAVNFIGKKYIYDYLERDINDSIITDETQKEKNGEFLS